MTKLSEILAITGKPGLYKLVSRGNNMLIVESLVDGKRMPTYARDKIVALSDVSMFTDADDIALQRYNIFRIYAREKAIFSQKKSIFYKIKRFFYFS